VNRARFVVFRRFDPDAFTTVLCDADGNLFPSEEPAFDASVNVTNDFVARYGIPARYTADELLAQTTGKNFRTTAVDLAVQGGVPIEETLTRGRPAAVIATRQDVVAGRALTGEELDHWVRRERDCVTAHLGDVLRPDLRVQEALLALNSRYDLAAVSSSASKRLDACFSATGLDSLIPAGVRFSAEDSLPVPTSKPNPAVYLFSGEALGLQSAQGVAIEDSVPGVMSAVAAGFVTIGNLMFVSPEERRRRTIQLVEAGASAVATCWEAIAEYLLGSPESSPTARTRPAAAAAGENALATGHRGITR
jgi:beta-phosphoglucomutase-like phosphatase (HAD superfamily)